MSEFNSNSYFVSSYVEPDEPPPAPLLVPGSPETSGAMGYVEAYITLSDSV